MNRLFLLLGSLLVTVALLAWSATAEAQDDYVDTWDEDGEGEVGTWEPETFVGLTSHLVIGIDTRLEAELDVTRSISDTGGVFFHTNVGPGIAQAYGGITMTPLSWLTMGAGLGLETAGSHWRAAGLVIVDHAWFYLHGVFETGASGPWHEIRMQFTVPNNVGGDVHLILGVMSRRYDGEGLILGARTGRWEFRGAVLFETERYLAEGGGDWSPYFGDSFIKGIFSVALRLL